MKFYRKNKGFTLVSLMITIIVAIILTSTIVISYNGVQKGTKKKQFAKEIYTIQKIVDEYKYRNNKYPATNVINFDISDKDANMFANEPKENENIVVLKEIDLYEAGVESLSRGLKKANDILDIYALSENTGIVYYLKGVKIGDDIYYKLTDELKKEIGLTVK